VLRKHPYFADLEPEAFDQLCRYAKHSTLKRGATIFSKGDPGISLFAVISGTVKISISSPDGRNAILNLIGAGEIFGEIALLDRQPRSADATANSNCELFIIDRREFIGDRRSSVHRRRRDIHDPCRSVAQRIEQSGRPIRWDGMDDQGARTHSPAQIADVENVDAQIGQARRTATGGGHAHAPR